MKVELNFKLLWSVIKKFWIIILASIIVMAAAVAVYTSTIPKEYASTALFYVINIQSEASYTQSALVSAAQSLAKDYIEIIKSDAMLVPVCKQLKESSGLNYSTNQINKMISCTVKSDTAAFTVTVTCTNRKNARIIVNAIEDNIETVISKTVMRDNCVKMLSSGKEAVKVAPNMSFNTFVGGVFGGTVSFVILVLKMMLDSTINTEDDIKKRFDLPIIGVIPVWNAPDKNK